MAKAVVHKLPVDSDAPKRARDLVNKVPLSRDARESIELIISELVTNVVRHGARDPAGELSMALRREGERVTGEVCGRGPEFSWAAPEPDRTGGRGLLIVDEIADRWGIKSNSQVCVWFECVDCASA
jgi:anti-sigma regulatory factor (Ser/Thr protein kinase)